jgi:hypothetical protein
VRKSVPNAYARMNRPVRKNESRLGCLLCNFFLSFPLYPSGTPGLTRYSKSDIVPAGRVSIYVHFFLEEVTRMHHAELNDCTSLKDSEPLGIITIYFLIITLQVQ